jgi:hypothetical protein
VSLQDAEPISGRVNSEMFYHVESIHPSNVM